MTWWQILVIEGVAIAGVLLAVMLGGWLVFRARSFAMPQPFVPDFRKKKPKGKAESYVSDLYQDEPEDLFDEKLTPAAARLRDQKESEHDQTMRIVKGKR